MNGGKRVRLRYVFIALRVLGIIGAAVSPLIPKMIPNEWEEFTKGLPLVEKDWAEVMIQKDAVTETLVMDHFHACRDALEKLNDNGISENDLKYIRSVHESFPDSPSGKYILGQAFLQMSTQRENNGKMHQYADSSRISFIDAIDTNTKFGKKHRIETLLSIETNIDSLCSGNGKYAMVLTDTLSLAKKCAVGIAICDSLLKRKPVMIH